MTLYIDAADMRRLVGAVGPAALMAQLAEAIREDFLRWDDFQTCARVANHSPQGVIELMPVSDAALYAFKYVNGHPRNGRHGLPTVMAFGVLADVATGQPVLLSEMTLATALRTAATSALAARHLARPDSRCMALIGNGAQGEFQALAFHAMLGITELRLFDVDSAATDKLVRNLAAFPALRCVRARSVEHAVRGADIVTTATADKTRATVLHASMVSPGMHINAIGGDCPGKTELDPRLLEHAQVVVEYAPQTRLEGEIQQMPAGFPVTELRDVLSGQARGRHGPGAVTVFDSVGFALEDFATLRRIYGLATSLGLGRRLALVPAMDDPKDLFGFLVPASGETAPTPGRSSALATAG